MIQIPNHQSYVMKNPNQDSALRQKLIRDVTNAIQASRPFIETITFHNQTNHCTMTITIHDGHVHVTVKNPEDEIFKLEENLT